MPDICVPMPILTLAGMGTVEDSVSVTMVTSELVLDDAMSEECKVDMAIIDSVLEVVAEIDSAGNEDI